MTTIRTAGLGIALLASLTGCSDSGPGQTIEGVSPEQDGTLQPAATTSPGGGLVPGQQQEAGAAFEPGTTLEPGPTLGPDTTAAP